MKQLVFLLLIISTAIASWSCFAASDKIYVMAAYTQSSVKSETMILQPSLSNQLIDERFSFTSNNSTTNHNDFFELAIIFNEKLHQFIALFTYTSETVTEVVKNNTSISKTSSTTASNTRTEHAKRQKCKASS